MMLFNSKFMRYIMNHHCRYSEHTRNYATQTATEKTNTCLKVNQHRKKKNKKVLTFETMNEKILNMEYTLRMGIPCRAKEIAAEIQQGVKKPFKEVIVTNIGDAQALGQTPITFLRQLAALALHPPLMDSPRFPADVKKRVSNILNDCLGQSLGSYTHSQGIKFVRKDIAEYINTRDGGDVLVDPDDIFLSDGGAFAIKTILCLFNKETNGKPTGCLLPVPQYPLYSAAMTLLGLHKIFYYLDEENKWALNQKELKRALEEAKPFCKPRVLILINPGNPTGQLLSRKCIEDTIKFAFREQLVIFADEVYQENVYDDETEFQSVRKVMLEMGMPYSKMELFSFNSASKGFSGECGFRAGYVECLNLDKDVKSQLLKNVSVYLCPNSTGQVVLDGVINPPKDGDPSCELYKKEKCCILNNLSAKAAKLVQMLNRIDGIKCNPVQGALYTFPQLLLPEKFIKLAKESNTHPDTLFAQMFLEEKGVCITPGSGFGQKPGTYHFRLTILPPMEKLEYVAKQLKDFMKKLIGE